MMKVKCLFFIIICVLVISVNTVVAQNTSEKEEVIQFKAIRFTNESSASYYFAGKLFERINERAVGEFEIDVIGGSEVISGRDQADATRQGVVDIAVVPATYYLDLVPQVSGIMASERTPSEEREVGYYDFLNYHHNKVGLTFLGRTTTKMGFHISTKNRVDGIEDLAGLQLRASPGVATRFITALGASPVQMGHGDTYTALERGLLDGVVGTGTSVVSYSQYEVLGYWVDHPFFEATAAVIIFNTDSWNGLPKHIQDLIIEEQKRIENEQMVEWCVAEDNKIIATLISEGMEPITFAEDEKEKFLNLAKQSQIKAILPDVGDEKEAEEIIGYLFK